jgi:uncharacterized protein
LYANVIDLIQMSSYCFRNISSNTVVASQVRPADTYLKRLFGLLFSAPLEPDAGLWLKPCSSIHMIGMRFAIDALFLDRNGTVVGVFPDLRPFRISPWVPSAYHCIELSMGQLALSNTRVGDKLSWSLNNAGVG